VEFDIMSGGRAGDEKPGLHRRTFVGEASMERDAKNVFEVKIDRVEGGQIRESIKWFTENQLLLADERSYLVYERLIEDAVRPPDKKTSSFDECDVRRKFHLICNSNRKLLISAISA
jgi:hypothetical protein